MTHRPSFRKAALEAARASDDKKSSDIKLYDVRRSSPLTDYFLVATVENAPQASAVQDEIDQRVRTVMGAVGRRRDGGHRANWRVIDYGGLVVHLMNAASRSFFGIERLWETARLVRWDTPPSAPPRRKARS
ncbi:MAG: ribosome silencing factor [Elusimicrobia bacterium]|nr:ribosome silencing factor [Elusimicrobiota bacterium]